MTKADNQSVYLFLQLSLPPIFLLSNQCSDPVHAEVVDRLIIVLKYFFGEKLGLLGAEYVIWRASEKLASDGLRYPTVADPPLVLVDNAKSGQPWEPLLSPIVVGA